jgi:hypothetical protein
MMVGGAHFCTDDVLRVCCLGNILGVLGSLIALMRVYCSQEQPGLIIDVLQNIFTDEAVLSEETTLIYD